MAWSRCWIFCHTAHTWTVTASSLTLVQALGGEWVSRWFIHTCTEVSILCRSVYTAMYIWLHVMCICATSCNVYGIRSRISMQLSFLTCPFHPLFSSQTPLPCTYNLRCVSHMGCWNGLHQVREGRCIWQTGPGWACVAWCTGGRCANTSHYTSQAYWAGVFLISMWLLKMSFMPSS